METEFGGDCGREVEPDVGAHLRKAGGAREREVCSEGVSSLIHPRVGRVHVCVQVGEAKDGEDGMSSRSLGSLSFPCLRRRFL